MWAGCYIQGLLTMNFADGSMKINHLTNPLFQPIVSLKRVVKLESTKPPLN